MSASSWFCESETNAIEPDEVIKQTSGVVVLHIAMLGQDCLSVLGRLREKGADARVLVLAVCGEERIEPPIQTAREALPKKICPQTANPTCSWINAVIWTLLAGCCAVTFFFAFEAPFRLSANGNQTDPLKFRAEIAALPASLGVQTTSRSRVYVSHRGGEYDKEVVSSSFGDSRQKRRLPRARLLQQKQSRLFVQSGQFSDRK